MWNYANRKLNDGYSISLVASSLVTATRVSVESRSPHRNAAFMAAFSSFPSTMTTASYLPRVQYCPNIFAPSFTICSKSFPPWATISFVGFFLHLHKVMKNILSPDSYYDKFYLRLCRDGSVALTVGLSDYQRRWNSIPETPHNNTGIPTSPDPSLVR